MIKHIIDLEIISDKQYDTVMNEILFTHETKYNIKNIIRDTFGGYITGVEFITMEDLVTFKLKYL